MSTWGWLGGVILFAVACSGAGQAPSQYPNQANENPIVRFDRTDFCAAASTTPPADCWESISLPDFWKNRIPLRHEAGWYRFRTDITGWNKAEVGVYVPRFGPNIRIWVDGMEIARSSQIEGEYEQHFRTPLFVKLRSEMLSSPNLIVYIRAAALPTRATTMGIVYVGNAAELYQSRFWRQFWQIDGQMAISFMIGALGLMALFVWLGDTKDPIFLWYAVAGILWPLASAELLLTVSPINRALLTHINSFALLVIVSAFAQFMLELTGRRGQLTDRALLGFAIIAAVCMPLLYEEQIPVRYSLFIAVMTLLLGAFLLWILFDQYRKQRDGLYLALLLACLVILLMGVHDTFTSWSVSFYMHSEIMVYGGFPLMACMGGALLRRYNTAKVQAATTQEQKANIARERERLRTIGHEIRSPLQSLLSLHGNDDDRSRRYVKRMQNAVETLFGSASPDQAFSSLQLELETLDLTAFLGAYVSSTQATIRDVKFEPSESGLFTRVDSARLEDVLDNLVANADRFRLPDTPILIRSQRATEGLQILLENQGPNIEPTRLMTIFEYGESSDKEHNGHQGLGLFVVKTHITRMGGHVVAQNTHDGVAFVITLPSTSGG